MRWSVLVSVGVVVAAIMVGAVGSSPSSSPVDQDYEDVGVGLSPPLDEIQVLKEMLVAVRHVLRQARSSLLSSIERRRREVSDSFSSLSFPSLQFRLLYLAFLTFVLFLVDLVQDLLNGTTRRSTLCKPPTLEYGADDEDRMTDLIVLILSSVDMLFYGQENPDCGRKLLCHLNRSGWHDGLSGRASNYFFSLVFSIISSSAFQDHLDAANFGREKQDCTSRYPSCPSVLDNLIPSRK